MVVAKHQRKDGITDTLLRNTATKKRESFTKTRVWNGESVSILERTGDLVLIRTSKGKTGYLQEKHLDYPEPIEIADPERKEIVLAKPTTAVMGRQWIKLWSGGYACFLGTLPKSERDDLVAAFHRNRKTDPRGYSLGLGRKLKPCEKEMSTVMWVHARRFRDTQASRSLNLDELQGDRLRSWLKEGWCTKWASKPETPDHYAFHSFCNTGVFAAPPGRVASKSAGTPAGIIPCCTTEAGEAMILLGRDSGGWSNFQGHASPRQDALEWDTAVREAAEEACESFGSSAELRRRFFSGDWVA